MRWFNCLFAVSLALTGITGCGYHSVGAATHFPAGVRTLAVPVFATRTNAYRTETVMTTAVIREFATRTRLRVTPDPTADADTTLLWNSDRKSRGRGDLGWRGC